MTEPVRAFAARELLAALCVFWGVFGAGPRAIAQTTRPTTLPPDELTVAVVESRKARVEAAADLSEDVKKTLVGLYDQALKQLAVAAGLAEEAAGFDALRAQAPAELESVRAEMAAMLAAVTLEVPPDATLEDLKRLLSDAEARLATAQTEAAQAADLIKRRADRRTEIQKNLTAKRESLDAIMRDLSAPPPASESAEHTLARRTLLLASKSAIDAELDRDRRELLAYEARADLRVARRDRAVRQLARAEEGVAFWQNQVKERQRLDAERQAALARQAAQAAVADPPALRDLAEENDRLARLRTGPDGLLAVLDCEAANLDRVSKTLATVKAQRESAQEKVRAVGVTTALSLLLRRQRAELPDPRTHRRAIRARRGQLADVQLKLIEIDDQAEALADLDACVADVMAQVGPVDDAAQQRIETAARDLLKKKRDLIDQLRRDYDQEFTTLVDLDGQERALAAEVGRYRRFIDEQVLWFRSAPPLKVGDVPRAAEAAAWLIRPAAWREVVETLWGDLHENPLPLVLGVVGLGLLAASGRGLRQRLDETAALVRRAQTDTFGLTVRVMVYTALKAAVWPALAWLLSWRLWASVGSSEFARAVGVGLQGVAVVLAGLRLLGAACLEGGLAEVHLRWPRGVARQIRRDLRWLSAIVLPAVFVTIALEAQAGVARKDSLGRLALVVGLGAAAAFLHRLFRASGPVVKEVAQKHVDGVLHRTRHVWYVLAVGLPPVLAVAAAVGYSYTALELAGRGLATAWTILGLLLAYGLMLRWVFVTRRRLAYRAAQERKAAEADRAEEGPSASAAAPEEPEVSLFTLGQQTRQLIQGVAVVAFVMALWVIWVDMLPALAILRQVGLWGEVSLADLLLAVVVVVVTVVLARNTPALLDLAVLRRLPLEASVRFAVTAVTRYLITIVGVVLAFGAIGIGWTKVQWLVAAITVGLGFGLQEIFANFVSGLIILFERPIRVGDTVTTGDITGTVTRIRIRATTIIDWDRKELIVPNKEFITGRLINWTLSDTIQRVRIPVGVAYGSDAELVQRLLLRVAAEEPNALDDPAPTAVFLGFGDNALNFELRLFADISVRLKVMHDVHMAIDRAFRDAGVTIAFPQRDVHLEAARPLDVRVRFADADHETSGRQMMGGPP